jgi:hypothetical protein
MPGASICAFCPEGCPAIWGADFEEGGALESKAVNLGEAGGFVLVTELKLLLEDTGGEEDDENTGGIEGGRLEMAGGGRELTIDGPSKGASLSRPGGRPPGASAPALLRSCIAVSNTSLRVAGRGGIARQLAMLLRRRRASTRMARVRGVDPLRAMMAIVSSRALSMRFHDAELWTGLTKFSLPANRPEVASERKAR